MNKKKLLLLAALVLILALAAWLLLAPRVCVAPIEQRTDSAWSLLHVYMSGEYEYTLPVTTEGQRCEFKWVSGRGSFSAEITNAAGEVLYDTEGGKDGTIELTAASDLTLHLKTKGHGGFFSLSHKELPPEDQLCVYQTGILTEGELEASFSCYKEGGRYLNFYVENRGEEDVILQINDRFTRTIPAGSSGHISSPIVGRDDPKEMVVTCVSADGGDVNIFWKVAQRRK